MASRMFTPNHIDGFTSDCCRIVTDGTAPLSELYQALHVWCRHHGLSLNLERMSRVMTWSWALTLAPTGGRLVRLPDDDQGYRYGITGLELKPRDEWPVTAAGGDDGGTQVGPPLQRSEPIRVVELRRLKSAAVEAGDYTQAAALAEQIRKEAYE